MDYFIKKRVNFLDGIFNLFSLTNWLILINLVVFVLSLIVIGVIGEEKFSLLFTLQANSFFSGSIWTPLTSMFLHAGPGHLLANMVSLFFLGNLVEKIIGRKRFFWLYILSGIFAGIFYSVLAYYFGFGIGERLFGSPLTFAVGASGAIFALLGVLAVLIPKVKVYLIMGPLVAIVVEAILLNLYPDFVFMGVLNLIVNAYIIVSILLIFSGSKLIKIAIPWEMPFWVLPFIAIIPLVIIGLVFPLPIGNSAHLGGLIGGLGYAYYLKKKYKRKINSLQRYFR